MKKSIMQSTKRLMLTIALCISVTFLFAQEHNLKTELLIYIMQDSLDLPVSERGKVGLQYATIKSLALANTLAKIKTKS